VLANLVWEWILADEDEIKEEEEEKGY